MAILDACLALLECGFRTRVFDDSSPVIVLGFLARLAVDALGAKAMVSGLGSRSGGALRLRDLGSGVPAAEALAAVTAAEGSAVCFVAERVTLGDMRY